MTDKPEEKIALTFPDGRTATLSGPERLSIEIEAGVLVIWGDGQRIMVQAPGAWSSATKLVDEPA